MNIQTKKKRLKETLFFPSILLNALPIKIEPLDKFKSRKNSKLTQKELENSIYSILYHSSYINPNYLIITEDFMDSELLSNKKKQNNIYDINNLTKKYILVPKLLNKEWCLILIENIYMAFCENIFTNRELVSILKDYALKPNSVSVKIFLYKLNPENYLNAMEIILNKIQLIYENNPNIFFSDADGDNTIKDLVVPKEIYCINEDKGNSVLMIFDLINEINMKGRNIQDYINRNFHQIKVEIISPENDGENDIELEKMNIMNTGSNISSNMVNILNNNINNVVIKEKEVQLIPPNQKISTNNLIFNENEFSSFNSSKEFSKVSDEFTNLKIEQNESSNNKKGKNKLSKNETGGTGSNPNPSQNQNLGTNTIYHNHSNTNMIYPYTNPFNKNNNSQSQRTHIANINKLYKANKRMLQEIEINSNRKISVNNFLSEGNTRHPRAVSENIKVQNDIILNSENNGQINNNNIINSQQNQQSQNSTMGNNNANQNNQNLLGKTRNLSNYGSNLKRYSPLLDMNIPIYGTNKKFEELKRSGVLNFNTNINSLRSSSYGTARVRPKNILLKNDALKSNENDVLEDDDDENKKNQKEDDVVIKSYVNTMAVNPNRIGKSTEMNTYKPSITRYKNNFSNKNSYIGSRNKGDKIKNSLSNNVNISAKKNSESNNIGKGRRDSKKTNTQSTISNKKMDKDEKNDKNFKSDAKEMKDVKENNEVKEINIKGISKIKIESKGGFSSSKLNEKNSRVTKDKDKDNDCNSNTINNKNGLNKEENKSPKNLLLSKNTKNTWTRSVGNFNKNNSVKKK